jgi:energy-coupling factor transport system ATP-binding protein
VNHVLASLKSQKERGTTIVVVSHDLDLLAQLVTRVVVLEEGHICIDANAGDLLTDAERLLSFGYDLPEIVRIAEHLHTEGRVPDRRLYTVEELRRILKLLLMQEMF